MSTDTAEPIGSADTSPLQQTFGQEDIGEGSSRNIAERRLSGIDETADNPESHADLDAYRTSRRLSRPISRLSQSLSPSQSRRGSSITPQLDGKSPSKDKHEGAPLCLVAYTHRVEACTASIQAWSDRQEEKAQSRRSAKADARVIVQDDGTIIEPKGDSFLESNIIIGLVAIILSWIYIVFTWRICVAGIRMEARAVVSRSEGIGLLVGFNVLWLITIWTYIRVVMTPPGFVRDHVAISEPPPPPNQEYIPPAPYPAADIAPHEQQRHEEATGGNINGGVDKVEETVDPSLPAVIGPLGAGLAAKVDEEKTIQAEQNSATPWTNYPPPKSNNAVPEPFRFPSSQIPPLDPSQLYCYRCKRVKPPRAHHCRRCATCVLQMDHHCPWVGGCVGARNHKYFYHFLQWVTALEYFVLIVDAIVFRRGTSRRSAGPEPGWSIDGYLISMFPICAMFILFTTALLITHSYLFMLNLTTIEHLAYERIHTREAILLSNYLDALKDSNGRKLEYWKGLKEKKRVKANWSQQWGNLKSEANTWWLDDRTKAMKREDIGKKTSWYHSIAPNWRQFVGDAWYDSFFPIGRAKSDGLSYEMNWRASHDGSWRPRTEWQRLKERIE